MTRLRACLLFTAAVCTASFLQLDTSRAQSAASDRGFWSWFSRDWSLTLGGAGFVAPSYEGAEDMAFSAVPMISLSRAGSVTRFTSRNDNVSFGLIDTGTFRAGPTAKLLLPRDDGDSDDLKGLDDVPWGVEVGAFAEFYPFDWLRMRGELRHGIHAHHGLVGDIAADAFYDIMPTLRLSGGPRLSLASASYFDAYYGVDAKESLASGLSIYDPDGGGVKSYGFGGALTWQATDKITTSLFAEYSRLTGPAADSSLVEERGSKNQWLFGASATYRFDFSL